MIIKWTVRAIVIAIVIVARLIWYETLLLLPLTSHLDNCSLKSTSKGRLARTRRRADGEREVLTQELPPARHAGQQRDRIGILLPIVTGFSARMHVLGLASISFRA